MTDLRLLCADISEHPTDIKHLFCHSPSPHPDLYYKKTRIMIKCVAVLFILSVPLCSVALLDFALSVIAAVSEGWMIIAVDIMKRTAES